MTTSIVVAAVACCVSLGFPAAAQVSKTITGDTEVVTATVEAIERSTREGTLKEPDGTYTVVTAPPEMKRFDELKVGDKVDITWTAAALVSLEDAPAKK